MRLSRILPPRLVVSTVRPALLGVVLAAGAAHGQTRQVGSFTVERKADLITDEDESLAAVMAQGGGQTLALIWHCFGNDLVLGLGLQHYGVGPEMEVVWRFDREEPEAGAIPRSSTGDKLYLMPDDYEHAFTTRVRSASRFVIRVMNGTGGPTDYVFDLNGSERALGTLRCVRNLRPPADPPGLLGRAADEIAPLDDIPLETRADTLRLFDHYTPPHMRDRRGEVALQVRVLADGRIDLDGIQVTRTPSEELNWPAMFIASHLAFPPGRARRVTVYVYFSPTGGHVQIEDPG